MTPAFRSPCPGFALCMLAVFAGACTRPARAPSSGAAAVPSPLKPAGDPRVERHRKDMKTVSPEMDAAAVEPGALRFQRSCST